MPTRHEQLVDRTEQRMLGHAVVFTSRWDHEYALRALDDDRHEFDAWVRRRRAERETQSVTSLVSLFFFSKMVHDVPKHEMTDEQRERHDKYYNKFHGFSRGLADKREARAKERRP